MEDRNAWYRNYRQRNLKKLRKYKKLYNRNEPEKTHARSLLYLAVKKGLIKREVCMVCKKVNAQGHHEDYSKPYDVLWFCPLHHKEHHKKLSTG